jgi:uncharacterized LabA/DUF88 family protein
MTLEVKIVSPNLVTKIEAHESKKHLAVLIDADNISATAIEEVCAEIAKHGEATVKRIYGDFTAPSSASWKKVLQQYAIKPIQQFAYTTGKNATDSSLIIDAMDLLYTGKFGGFCLITSDSDFTGLAMRLREEGLLVLGFGEEKTPKAFRSACHSFMIVPNLKLAKVEAAPPPSKPISPIKDLVASPTTEAKQKIKFSKQLAINAFEQCATDQGWLGLGAFGSNLRKVQPNFNIKLYGYTKLSSLVKAKSDLFVTENRSNSLYLKLR